MLTISDFTKTFINFEIKLFLSFFGKIFPDEIINNIGRFSRMSLIPTLGTCIPFAIITTFHGWAAVELFGSQRFLPGATTLVMFREVAPVISALIITAVVGTAISSEISLMKLRGEFTYLEVIGVPPMNFVIIPRVVATTLVCVLIFSCVSITSIGGIYLYLVYWKGLAEGIFNETWNLVSIRDVIGGLIKSFVFGFIIGNISSFLGYNSEESSEGVGKASSTSVIANSLVFITVNIFLSYALFGGFTTELK
jgi:phospholipid/cholesterol/gamma-HCH transport system permease protein